ncbi:MAG: hydrogenase maturation nickel metallochaperone HypA [Xanthomonadaceae bacterium]|nr:hydrogenase maturation nickel metallochaperone HypA [Xanthomonadaceae bacterium]
MHELSLAQGLMNQLVQLAAENNASRVVRAQVRIGPLAGVVVDSFRFGFDAIKSMFSVTCEAVLELDCPSASYRCPVCGRLDSSCRLADIPCPDCGDNGKQFPVGDDDLILLQVELEEDDDKVSGLERGEN